MRAFSTPLYDEFGDPIVVDVVVYISDSTDGSLQAINGVTGAVDWTLQNPCGGGTSDPAFASGNVWMGSDDPGFAGISPSGVGVYCITADDFYGSPPVAGGGSVYASGENEELAAMDAVTGKLRWVEGGATTTSPGYGWPTLNSAGTDVYVSGGTAASDIDDINELNAATGAVIWSSPIGCSWPTIADDGSVLYVGGSCGLFAVSAATGTIQWHSSSSLASNFGPPVIAGNLIIAGTDQGLAAFNATTGKLLWRNTKVVNSGSYTAANGVVYLDEGSSLVMLNSSTGAQLGTRQPPSGFQFDGDAIPVDGHIYLAAYGPTGDRLIAYAP